MIWPREHTLFIVCWIPRIVLAQAQGKHGSIRITVNLYLLQEGGTEAILCEYRKVLWDTFALAD